MDLDDSQYYPTKIKDTTKLFHKQIILDDNKFVSKEEFKQKYMLPIRDFQKEYEKQQEEKRMRDEEIENRYYRDVLFHTYDYRDPKTIQKQLIIKNKEKRKFNIVHRLNENEYEELNQNSLNIQFLMEYYNMTNAINVFMTIYVNDDHGESKWLPKQQAYFIYSFTDMKLSIIIVNSYIQCNAMINKTTKPRILNQNTLYVPFIHGENEKSLKCVFSFNSSEDMTIVKNLLTIS